MSPHNTQVCRALSPASYGMLLAYNRLHRCHQLIMTCHQRMPRHITQVWRKEMSPAHRDLPLATATASPWKEKRVSPAHHGMPSACVTRKKLSPAQKGTPSVYVIPRKSAEYCHHHHGMLCRSGDGGNGEIVQAGRGRWVANNKYQQGGQQAKKIWLPASA